MTAFDDTLSVMLNSGLKPHFVRYSAFSQKALTIVSSFAAVIGVTRIEFDIQSHRVRHMVMTFIDCSEKLLLKLKQMVSSFFI